MTKADVIARIASETGLTKTDVRLVVEGFLDSVKDALKKNKQLEIRKFGTFSMVDRAPRKARWAASSCFPTRPVRSCAAGRGR